MDYDWNKLNHLQIGKYAEYLTKMELTAYGCDVYSSEIDDKGIDFVVRQDAQHYYDIQVKSARLPNTSYVFIQKAKFSLRENLFLSLVLFNGVEKPLLYLIPSKAWYNPNPMFISRD
jgi:hypothetical protein